MTSPRSSAARTFPVALLRLRAVAADQRAIGEEMDCEVLCPNVVLSSREEVLRESLSAFNLVKRNEELTHAHKRSKLAGRVAEILPDRASFLEGRQRRDVVAGVRRRGASQELRARLRSPHGC
jgi:hypothetical protein